MVNRGGVPAISFFIDLDRFSYFFTHCEICKDTLCENCLEEYIRNPTARVQKVMEDPMIYKDRSHWANIVDKKRVGQRQTMDVGSLPNHRCAQTRQSTMAKETFFAEPNAQSFVGTKWLCDGLGCIPRVWTQTRAKATTLECCWWPCNWNHMVLRRHCTVWMIQWLSIVNDWWDKTPPKVKEKKSSILIKI